MNVASLFKAHLHNKAQKLLPNFDVRTSGNMLTITPPQTEYNNTVAVQTSEWINPYVKLDAKTNRFRKVKGYWRKTEAPAQQVRPSITGTSSKFLTMSNDEKVKYLLGGKV